MRQGGPPKAEPGRWRRVAVPLCGAALIQMRLNSAVHSGPRPGSFEPDRQMGHHCTVVPAATLRYDHDIARRIPWTGSWTDASDNPSAASAISAMTRVISVQLARSVHEAVLLVNCRPAVEPAHRLPGQGGCIPSCHPGRGGARHQGRDGITPPASSSPAASTCATPPRGSATAGRRDHPAALRPGPRGGQASRRIPRAADRQIYSIISSALDLAVRYGRAERNVARNATPSHFRKREPTPR